MCEGYNDGDADFSGLEDEFLCEYVDGTMDPVVREVFEEYLRMNPELNRHVECLRNTRLLLCRYGCRCHAPRDLNDRLRRQITCEMMNAQVPFHVVLSDRLRSFATATSAVALVFMVGMLAGVSVGEPNPDAVPAITLLEIRDAQKSAQHFRDRSAAYSHHQPYYPSLSSFVPLSTVRSTITSDSHPGWEYTDINIATLYGTRSAP